MKHELRICNHVHECNYGKDNVGGFCVYAQPKKEEKSSRPVQGHCITVGGAIRLIRFDKDEKSEDPNVSFRIHKIEKNIGIN